MATVQKAVQRQPDFGTSCIGRPILRNTSEPTSHIRAMFYLNTLTVKQYSIPERYLSFSIACDKKS